MKKKLALLLALVLVLSSFVAIATACNKDKGLTDDQLKSLLADVKKTHNDLIATITNSNYTVSGKATAGSDGTEAQVSWTSSSDKVTISSETNAAGNYSVTVPDRSTLTEDLSYTLTATLVDSNGNAYKDSTGEVASVTFNHTVQMLGASYAVITFDNKAKATDKGAEYKDSFGNVGYEYITWTESDITVKAIRGESTSGSADYINPARFYSKSKLEISYVAPMKAIKITLNSATQNAGGFDGMKVDGTKITRVDDVIVIELTTPATKFESAPLTAQTRVNKIEVYTNEVPSLDTDPEPSHDTTKTVNDLATTAPTDNMKLIYEVEGVWVATGDADDTKGGGLLYDKTTGKSLIIYGIADSASAFEWGGSNYGFTNPDKFQEIKTQFKDGDMIKLGVAYSTQYTNYYSYFISKTSDADTITYGASVTCTPTEGGSASLSATTGLKYGDEVTVTITPASADYVVKSVTVDGKTVTANEGTYKFTVVPGPNAVVVTFGPATVVPTDVTLTKATLFAGLSGTSYATYNGEHTVGNYTITTSDVLGNTYGTAKDEVLQFKASTGTLTFDGQFTKIVITQLSTYEYDKTNFIVVSVGGTVLTGTKVSSEKTESMSAATNGYAIYKHVIEFTITGNTAQEIKITSGTTSGAKYITSIQCIVESAN